MPNVTSVWDFSPGETLTAAKLDDVNCGIHVFSGTATRDAAYGGSGERALSEGEFAYLADTNTTQYYDGAAWQTVGGGLQYITGASFSGVTSVSLPNNTFTSSYRNYRLFFQITSSTSDADISMRLRASGSDITSSNYDNVWWVIANTGGSSLTSSLSQSSWTMGEVDSANPWCYIVLDVIAPQVTTNTFVTGQYSFVDKVGSNYITRTGSGVFRLTTSVDALSVISSVASSITGVYRVYGYSES